MTELLPWVGVAVTTGLLALCWRAVRARRQVRFGAAKLYFTAAVTRAEAERVGQFLLRKQFETDARITRDGDTFQLQIISGSKQPDAGQELACEALAAALADDVFAGEAVEVQMCDSGLRPTATVRHRGRFGRRIVMNAAELFYAGGVTDAQAVEVATFLAGVGLFNDSPKLAQMNCTADGYEFRLSVNVDHLTPEMVEGERQMGADLTRVLKGATTARFCNGTLGTLRPTEPPSAEPGPAPGGPYRSQVFVVSPEASGESD